MSPYPTRLHRAVFTKGTPALVGLDPRFERLPEEIRRQAEQREETEMAAMKATAYEEFCTRLIDVVAPLVPAVKPQAAFFEELGPSGCRVLQRVIHKARDAGLIVLLDGKRGDIGSTAEAYARGYLAGRDPDAAPWAADALTVNPYLGRDALEPFLEVAKQREAGVYVLVRTSNPGAGLFQDRPSDAGPLYRHVAEIVHTLAESSLDATGWSAVGAVVAATSPDELRDLRRLMPHCPFLVPGYGAQGAGASQLAAAFASDGLGALVNSSRGINFARDREPYRSRFAPREWEEAVEAATKDMIRELAENTPAGKLVAKPPVGETDPNESF